MTKSYLFQSKFNFYVHEDVMVAILEKEKQNIVFFSSSNIIDEKLEKNPMLKDLKGMLSRVYELMNLIKVQVRVS